MAKFGTDEWFAKVDELTEAAGDLENTGPTATLVLNLTIGTDSGEVEMAMNAGALQRGHVEGAPATLTIPADVYKKVMMEGDGCVVVVQL